MYLETDRRDLLESPQDYADWKQQRVATITNPNDVKSFFLHEHDGKGKVVRWFGNTIFQDFHLKFWYTHNLSPISMFRNNYKTTPLHGYSVSATTVSLVVLSMI